MTLDKGLWNGCLGKGMDTSRKGRSRGRGFQVGMVFSVQPLPQEDWVARRDSMGARSIAQWVENFPACTVRRIRSSRPV